MSFRSNKSWGLSEEEKFAQYHARLKLISSYLISYRKTLNINHTYSDKVSAFNRFYVGQFRVSDPLRITETVRLPPSVKNPVMKIQAKGTLEGIGEFAGRGTTCQEAIDRAYFYIFQRLHRLWSFFNRAHAKSHLTPEEFYNFLFVESLETVRLVERTGVDGQYSHSIVIVDCRQFLAKSNDQSEARAKSIEALRQFISDVNDKIKEIESSVFDEEFDEEAAERELEMLNTMMVCYTTNDSLAIE